MSFASWLSLLGRFTNRRNQRRRNSVGGVAAIVEVFETKALLSGYAGQGELWLPHSTPTAVSSATTSLLYGDDFGSPTVAITVAPTKGTVVDNGDGTFTYAANPNQIGSDSFDFEVTDSEGATHSGFCSVDLTNNGADAGYAYFAMQHSISGGIATHTTSIVYGDFDGDQVTVTIITAPTKGTLVDSTSG